jgi:hypothetical protein
MRGMKLLESIKEFEPFYLEQHQKPLTRWLHFIGTSCFLISLILAVIFRDAKIVLSGIVIAYGIAWVSHFFIEKNKPATFTNPLLSLICDFRMWARMLGVLKK